MSPGPKLLVAAAILAAVFGSYACSRSGPSPTLIPTPTPVDIQKLLGESGRVMENLQSFHFHLSHRNGGTVLPSNLVIEEAEGDVIKPDKISTEFSGTFGPFVIKSGLITLGDDSYLTNPLTRRWESVPREVSPLGFFNPRRGIAAMMFQVQGATMLPDGEDVYRIKGSLPAKALAPLLGDTVEDATVTLELSLDAHRLYLLKAIVEGRVTPSEPDGTFREIRLSRFNEPVVIEPPQ